LCMIVSIVLMTIDHRFNEMNTVRAALSTVAYPLQYLVDLPFRAQTWATETLTTRNALIRENRLLRKERLLLHARLQKLSALEHENARLRELLKSSSRLRREKVLIAELLAVDLDPYRQRIVINKGTTDGVYAGQPLLDAYGVMGQITEVSRLGASGILISDPSHALPVEINRNGLRMLAFGTGNSQVLSLRHVPANADVQVGDTVSTSGLGGRYPPDYPVARITRVEHPSGEPFALIEAQPFAHLDRSREVLLVWSEPRSLSETPPAAAPEPQNP
jgi:rod shape-determining protein MreC